MQIAIIGAGSFGTVLADIAAHNECEVKIYARREETVHAINLSQQNTQYLSPPEQIVQNCRGENSRTLLLWNLISAGVSPGLTHF